MRMWCGTNASSGESQRITVAHLVTYMEDGDNVILISEGN